ncbi:MAG: sulfurtransferase FdhD [Hyphomicrobiales bacterium]|nr:MAG: sulfurtransferase FdhD [Hyphomicrobiales bacterium]
MSEGVKSVNAHLNNGVKTKSKTWVLPEECPIAIYIDGESEKGETYAVMLTTPLDLIDFAYGFCLSEGLVKATDAIISVKQKLARDGVELHVKLNDDAYDRFQIIERRRRLAGASGCGVCGLTSLSHIVEDLPKIDSELTIRIAAIQKARVQLRDHTPLNQSSFSVHAAAFVDKDGDILLVREDVGRHNALDKLCGALTQQDIDISQGFVLLTSRFAYELAQKCIKSGVPIVISISAPTTMAVNMAKKANMTFAAFDGDSDLMVFSNAERLI